MSASAKLAPYFSFFMFTADLRPDDASYRDVIIRHLRVLKELGYSGFDVPIAPGAPGVHEKELESYLALKQALDEAGLADVRFTTNVGATRRFDPTSEYREQRDAALAYLRSRVDITTALGGDILAGPIVYPYNVYPLTDAGQSMWSDELQSWLTSGYRRAQPVLEELGQYAASKNVRLAIEPVDHWETPAPNSVTDVLDFLEGVPSRQVGVCIDSAHVMLAGGGPAAFAAEVRRAADADRLHYVHISAPDRGAIHESWIPWKAFLEPILESYEGPLLLEAFNAVEPFVSALQLTRRKFWIPEEEPQVPDVPSAYSIAETALGAFRDELSKLQGGESVSL